MVSKKTIKGYGFNNIEEYFEYITDSRINGQRQQAKELYKDLSTRQKNQFMNWYFIAWHYEALDNDTTTEHEYLNLMNYLND